jgi:hypothetical protein
MPSGNSLIPLHKGILSEISEHTNRPILQADYPTKNVILTTVIGAAFKTKRNYQ